MNTNQSKTATKVMVETDEKTFVVEAPLFILFAEFLGYVSIFNDFAEKWCDGKVPEMHVQKVLLVEAKSILRQMKKDYSKEEIREFYQMYYPLILQEYEEKLASIITNDDDDE